MDTAASPAFLAYKTRLKDRVDAELDIGLSVHFPTLAPPGLDALRVVLAGGKRLRGCLTCLVAQALGGRVEDALPAAVAIEIVQGASLVHDDLVDADVVRRGRAAAWTWLTPRRAVLAADVMFATALERMAAIGAAHALTLARAISEMARGAMQELVDDSTYVEITAWKTGSLFAAATRLGAHSASASEASAAQAQAYGARTGYAYQVADDLVDVREAARRSLNARDILRLLPTLRHFAVMSGMLSAGEVPRSAESFHSWLARAAPRLMEAMYAEIELALRQAEREAEGFPDNLYGQFLRQAPRDCVRIMTRPVESAPVFVP